MTNEELERFFAETTAAQSMLLAAVLRPLIESGALPQRELETSLAEKERAALDRRTPEVSALLGLIELLRRDLGLPAASRPASS